MMLWQVPFLLSYIIQFQSTYGQSLSSSCPNGCTCVQPYVSILIDNTTSASNSVKRLFTNDSYDVSVHVNMECSGKTPRLTYSCILADMTWTLRTKKLQKYNLRVLDYITYPINCAVKTKKGGLFSSASVDVEIAQPGLVAIFSAEYATVRGTKSIMLNAMDSYDPELDGDRCRGLNKTWYCRLEHESFPADALSNTDVQRSYGRKKQSSYGCFGFGPGRLSSTQREVSINVNSTEANQILVFMLTVWKEDRNDSTSNFLLPKRETELRCVENCGDKVEVSRRTVVTWHCSAQWCKGELWHTWSLYEMEKCGLIPVQNLETLISTSINSSTLAFIGRLSWDKTSLKAGTNYKISLTTYQGSDVMDISHLVLRTNTKPYVQEGQKGCTVSPSQGIALKTLFVFECDGWFDEDDPLSYIFKYSVNSDVVTFYEGQASNTSAVMPLGDSDKGFSLVVEVVVQDNLGASTFVLISLKVSIPESLDVDEVEGLLNVTDANEVMQNALVILTIVDASEMNASKKSKVKEEVLNKMVNISATNLEDVKKLASIVNMATKNEEEVTPTIEDNALTMLDDLVAVTSQWQNRSDDPAVVKETGSTLLRCISNVMSLALATTKMNITDQRRAEVTKNTKQTLELIHKMGSVLVQTIVYSEDPQEYSTDSFLMLLDQYHLTDLGGEIADTVVLPSFKDIIGKESGSLSFFNSQLIKFPDNPYNWDTSSRDIDSSVVDFSLKTSEGTTLEVTGLKNPVELYIPRNITERQPSEHFFAKPSEDENIPQFHLISIPSKDVSVSLTITPNGNRRVVVYVSAEKRPTVNSYDFRTVLPNIAFCQNRQVFNCSSEAYTFSISSATTGTIGEHYIGIRILRKGERNAITADQLKLHLRLRRDCESHNGRRKRSCILTKVPPTTILPIIQPIYDASTDVNYSMSVNVASCKYWSSKSNTWTSEGCKAGTNSVSYKIQCICTHLSAFGGNFFAEPNPIDFDVVWASGVGDNFSVLATVCTIFALYFLCLIYARRADKKDHAKIIADVLVAGDFGNAYQYQIYVRTGIWRGCGTSANVGIALYGENGCTGTIHLTDSQTRKKFFARASVNHFTLYVPESLGQLYKIELWHDDTGNNSAWFVEDVCIVDNQTTAEWHFLARKWLAVEKGEGKLKVDLRAADEEQLKTVANLTYTRAAKSFADSHLWLSIFTKPPHNKFTRCQRLSCCLSTFFAAMVANAMFYQFGKEAQDTFKVGPLQVSWTQIMIAIQSSLVAVPVNVLLVLIFRYAKESKGDRYELTADQKSQSGCLPHFFVYIAWVLCLATAITSATFTVFYSISWGEQISNQWLTSILVSFFEDILVLQPLKVVLLASLLSMIMRKLPQRENIVGPSLWIRQKTASVMTITSAVEKSVAFKNREHRKKLLKMHNKFIEMATFLVFVILLMIVCYGNRNETRYMITRSLKETFDSFEEVGEPPEFWNWTKDTLVPGLYKVTWYNSHPFNSEGFISTREAFLIGMPRLRQIRVKPEWKCNVRNYPVIQAMFERCMPFNMVDNEDTTPFQTPGWIPVPTNSQDFLSDFEELCPRPWRYSTAHELQTTSFHGQTYSYGGGGYVADLGYNSTSANEFIDILQKNVWIDDKTAGVFIEFTVFEPSTSLITSVKYLYERHATGQTTIVTKVKTLTLYSPTDPLIGAIYEVCQLLFILVVCFMLFAEIVKLARDRAAYFKFFWNWVELIEIMSAASSLAMFILKEKYTSRFVKNVQANPFETSSGDYLVLWSELEVALLSFVIFIVTIKFLRIIRFNRHVCQMMATLKRSFKHLVSFSAVFITALLGFSNFGHIVFGHNVKEYSTYDSTFCSLLTMTLGGRMYYNELTSVDNVLSPLFLFAYMLFIGFILVSLFVTILMDTYSHVSNVSGDEDFSDADMGDFMADYIIKCIKGLRKKLMSSWEELRKGWKPRRRSSAGLVKLKAVRRKRSRRSKSSEDGYVVDVELRAVATRNTSEMGNTGPPSVLLDRRLDSNLSTWHDMLLIYTAEEIAEDIFLGEIVQCFQTDES